jgi:three-Cys-motif partner protein
VARWPIFKERQWPGFQGAPTILSKWNGRLLFLDGFAGRGRYVTGEEGSPLIALERLIKHRHFDQMKHRKFVFFFVEADEDNANSLRTELGKYKARHDPWPDCVKFNVLNEPFDKTASDILQHLREQKRRLAPTFAFVDPFGYSGLPMDLIAELLAYPRTEVFVNFMVGHVQRFIERDGQEDAMRGLFGIDVREILADFDGEDRVEHLRQVYGKQLQQRAGFDYVQSFAMKNKTGNIGYYLFHGTRHRLGVKLMKAAMWKIDPGGGYTFSDRLAGQDVLFAPEPDLGPLRAAILSQFTGRQAVLIDEIEWFTILQTPYRETHVRSVLTPLEKENLIRVDRPGKRGFPPGKARVSFLQ